MNAEIQKVALITGASKGMGAACARELASRGYQLSLFARSDSLTELGSELGALTFQGDITNPVDLQTLVENTISEYGRIDAVINSTGHPPRGELIEFTDRQWSAALDLLLMNAVRLARLVTPGMLRQGSGAIVNISTAGAREPDLQFPLSSAIRGALRNFMKLYAGRYAADNIRMNNLLPGRIDSFAITEAEKLALPMNRQGTVTEIAKTVAFMLSDDAGYLTGQEIMVDGGMTKSV